MFRNGAISELDLIDEWRSQVVGAVDFISSVNDIRLLQLPVNQPTSIFQRCLQSLTPCERRRTDRYRNPTRRQAFIIGRGTLRMLLGILLGVPPREVPLSTSASGKPQLLEPAASPIRFNVSHSRRWIVLGLSSLGEIGVDIEEYDPAVDGALIARNYFQPLEQETCSQTAKANRQAVFYRIWTCKEAAWKLIGQESELKWNDIQVEIENNLRSSLRLITQTDKILGNPRSKWTGFSWTLPTSVVSLVTSVNCDLH